MKKEVLNNYRDSELGMIGSLTKEPHCFNCAYAITCEHEDCIEGQLICHITDFHIGCGMLCDEWSQEFDFSKIVGGIVIESRR